MPRDQLPQEYVEVQTALPKGWEIRELRRSPEGGWLAYAGDPYFLYEVVGEGATEDEAMHALAVALRRFPDTHRG